LFEELPGGFIHVVECHLFSTPLLNPHAV